VFLVNSLDVIDLEMVRFWLRILHQLSLHACQHFPLIFVFISQISTIFIVSGEIAVTVAMFIAAWFWEPSLATLGFIYLIAEGLFLWVSIIVILSKGWFRRYYCGLFGSFALTVSFCRSLITKQLPRRCAIPTFPSRILLNSFKTSRTALLSQGC